MGETDKPGKHLPQCFGPLDGFGLKFKALVAHAADDNATGLGGSERVLGPPADERPFFLGKGGVDVEQEWVRVGPSSATMKGTRCFIRPLM